MAIIKCQHCEYTKEIAAQYAEKTVKCPSCGQSTKVHDTIALFTAFSEKLAEFQTELDELKQVSSENQLKPPPELNDELTQALSKIFRDHRIAMTEFNDAAKKRDVITQRTEQRTSQLFRFSVLGLFAIILILLFFIFEFTGHFQTFSKQFFSMNSSIQTIGSDLSEVKTSLIQLNTTAKAMSFESGSEISTLVATVNQNVAKMQSSMDKVTDKVKGMNDNIAYLTEKVEDFTTKESNSFQYRYYRQ